MKKFLIFVIIVLIIIGGVYFYSKKDSSTVVTPDPVATTTEPQANLTSQVKLFYYKLEDNGQNGKKIGCGDSVIGIAKTITPTQAPLRAALDALFADKRQTVDGLSNVLYQSNLKVDSLAIVSGVATVKLSGTYTLGGVCDNPRFMAQIEETVMQFPTITESSIFINNKTIESLLSGKGE
jgi:hypothetical protein